MIGVEGVQQAHRECDQKPALNGQRSFEGFDHHCEFGQRFQRETPRIERTTMGC